MPNPAFEDGELADEASEARTDTGNPDEGEADKGESGESGSEVTTNEVDTNEVDTSEADTDDAESTTQSLPDTGEATDTSEGPLDTSDVDTDLPMTCMIEQNVTECEVCQLANCCNAQNAGCFNGEDNGCLCMFECLGSDLLKVPVCTLECGLDPLSDLTNITGALECVIDLCGEQCM